MGTYLDDIVTRHRVRAASDTRNWRERMEVVVPRSSTFAQSLRAGENIAVIAEIKRKSPSKGWLAPTLDCVHMAALYAQSGASAISVLTDEDGFGGTLQDLRDVSAVSPLALLRKDFTVCHNDVLDAFDAGADAILLIVAALTDGELSEFHALATQLGMDVLVEIHSEGEAERAVALGSSIIGINQRSLNTFEVDSDHAAQLASSLPSHVIKVCESGLRTPDDVATASRAGFDAVLVGEHFVTSNNPGDLVRAFASIARS